MPNKTFCPSGPSIQNKDIKIRVHHLSHYFIRLSYDSSEKHSLNLHLALKNYSDLPTKSDSIIETTFKIFMTPHFVIRENKCCCGMQKGTQEKQSPSFHSLFEELEKIVNKIIEVKTHSRKIKREVHDKNERRVKLKHLKKARLQAEASLVELVKRELLV